MKCPSCDKGLINCSSCKGKGGIFDIISGGHECRNCNSSGKVRCPNCGGKGNIQ